MNIRILFITNILVLSLRPLNTSIIDENPIMKFSLYKVLDITGSVKSLETSEIEENLYGKPNQGYFTTIYLGEPPQKLNVLIDTGSSNFAVAGKPFNIMKKYFDANISKTFTDMKTEVEVPYTQGKWTGFLGSDVLSIKTGYEHNNSNKLVNIKSRVNVALIDTSTNFFINGSDWSGILGLGYSRLSRPDSTILPPLDQMVLDRIVRNIFSIQLCSYNSLNRLDESSNLPSGTLIFGGIHRIAGASLGLECNMYNNDRTIVDTGTTNFRVDSVIFNSIVSKLREYEEIGIPEEFWQGYEIMCWEIGKTPFNAFPDLTISLSSVESEYNEFSLIITPQLYLREALEENSKISNQNCYRFAISKSEKGIVIGAVFMEGFYVVFDRENSKIGFAESSCGAHLLGNNLNLLSPDVYLPISILQFT
ncbi:hypothetical protein MXB_117 [Myxobolus squamalis]|nr:hypothetical protein MXB_117 [Myxobolus squamalis]